MIDDDYFEARLGTGLAIIECAFRDAVSNQDCSELDDEIKRGMAEIMACADDIRRFT